MGEGGPGAAAGARGRVVCVTDGSYGDVLPFLAIASRLAGGAAAGRPGAVFLLCSAHFEELVARTNASNAAADPSALPIRFVPTCSKQFYDERWGAAADPDRSISSQSTLVAGARSMVERQRDIYRLLKEVVFGPGHGGAPADAGASRTLILAHPLVSASKIFVENFGGGGDRAEGVAMMTVLLSPIYLRSLEHRVYPAFVMRWYWYLADVALDAVLAGPINALRREIAVEERGGAARRAAPVRRVCHDWIFSDLCVLSLFPSWFTRLGDAAARPSRAGDDAVARLVRRTRFMGFLTPERSVVGAGAGAGEGAAAAAPLRQLERSGLPDEVVSFLRGTAETYGGDARFIVFTPGSLNPPNATRFFREAALAVRRINANAKASGAHRLAALFLTKYESVLPPDLRGAAAEDARRRSIAHFSFVSLSALLPFCHLCVHHGGIGTIGSCLSTSTPSIVVPSAFDQFDNAEIIEGLGVGLTVHEKDLSSDSLIAAMRRLMDVGGRAAPARARRGGSRVSSSDAGGAPEWERVRDRCGALAGDIAASPDNVGRVAELAADFLASGRVSPLG